MSTVADRRQGLEAAEPWSPARFYLIVAGIYLVITGGAGFFYNRAFPIGRAAVGREGVDYIFGIFETNGWHNLAGFVFGVIALYFFFFRPERARLGAFIVSVPNALVTITFAMFDPRLFWFASNGADNVVHALLGFGGIAAALVTRPSHNN
jgi:hypothetical protein